MSLLNPTVWLRPTRRSFFRHIATSSVVPERQIYISESTNPYFNLSFEDWLFRHKPHHEPLLLLYRDDPCVVIGRNQNPWKEVNLEALRARKNVPFIRRRSGGGTVYHDLGNTNFSIHLPRTSFDRHETAKVVLRAVRSLGIDANVNDRNDICVGKEKVSGSAYKIVNKRAYHHGTMLISTRLDTLGDLLRTNKETMETKGVASVRSPVCNLNQFKAEITHDMFVDAVIREFQQEYGVSEEAQIVREGDFKELDYIKRGMDELPSWDWAYGQTPEFTYSVTRQFTWGKADALFKSKHGVILECKIRLSESSVGIEPEPERPSSEDTRDAEQLLEGERYGFVPTELEKWQRVDPRLNELREWLKEVMET